MKKLIIKIVLAFKKETVTKYIVQILLLLGLLVGFAFLAMQDVTSNIFGAVIGFLFSTLLLYFMRAVLVELEDLLKVNLDTEALLKTYSKKNYRKTLTLGGTSTDFAYAETIVNDGYEFEIIDDKDKTFELDDFILNNYEKLFSAHSSSAKVNGETIRLDKVEIDGKKCTLYLSRSTYFNHLVTNRAIDFQIFDDVCLRDIYEYGPEISSYEQSKMSNHIGINGLVFLSDGALLVPRRKNTSTISKNKVTASIAVKLNYPRSGGDTITTEHFLYGNIIDNLSARTKIPATELHPEQIEVEFLGFGQSLYEGGKPQFYYAVHLKDIDSKKYLEICDDEDSGPIDVDKCIYVADYSSFHFKKDQLCFKALDKKNKWKQITCGYEISYLCNIWHYEESQKRKNAQ